MLHRDSLLALHESSQRTRSQAGVRAALALSAAAAAALSALASAFSVSDFLDQLLPMEIVSSRSSHEGIGRSTVVGHSLPPSVQTRDARSRNKDVHTRE